jgi:predicted nucleic acid-binding protein
VNKVFVLDAGPLGAVAHPRANPELTQKLLTLLKAQDTVIVPEISDYEVRRNLLLERLNQSIEKLDQLKRSLAYLPLTTDAMLKAAEFWAEIRQKHRRTADDKALDGDVILAAQAFSVGATVVTENPTHLEEFVPVLKWQDI